MDPMYQRHEWAQPTEATQADIEFRAFGVEILELFEANAIDVLINDQHACRYCARHDCVETNLHERLLNATKIHQWKSEQAQNECPSCLGDVRQPGPCLAVVAR